MTLIRLLLSDLQALRGLRASEKGRRIFRAAAISLVWMAVVSAMWGWGGRAAYELTVFETRPERVKLILRLLVPGLVISVTSGLGQGRKALFEHPALELLMSAPVSAAQVLLAVWIRTSLLACLWVVAIVGPSNWLLIQASGSTLSLWGYSGLVVVAAVSIAVPVSGILFLVHLVLTYLTGGRAGRLINMLLHVAVSFAFFALVILGLIARDRSGFAAVPGMDGQNIGLRTMLAAPASMLDAAAGNAGVWGSLVHCGVPVAVVAALLVAVGTPLYRGAYARARMGAGGRAPSVSRSQRLWPAGGAAVMFRKDVALLLGQPRHFVSLMFGPLLALGLAWSGELDVLSSGPGGSPFPELWTECFAVFALWWITTLTVLAVPLMRVVQLEAAQWSLYRASPAMPRSLVLQKAQLPLLVTVVWPLLVAAGTAWGLGLAGIEAIALGSVLLLPVAVCLGVWLMGLSTWPWLVRPDDATQASPRGSLAVFLAMFLLVLLVIPVATLAAVLAYVGESFELSGVLIALLLIISTWMAAAVATVPGYWWAVANMRQLLAPER